MHVGVRTRYLHSHRSYYTIHGASDLYIIFGRLTGVKACKTLWSTLECESTVVFVNDAV